MGCNIDPLSLYEALAVIIRYRKEKCSRHLTGVVTENNIEAVSKTRNRKVKTFPITIEEDG